MRSSLVLLGVLVLGCQASVQSSGSVNANGEATAKNDADFAMTKKSSTPSKVAANSAPSSQDSTDEAPPPLQEKPALFGARAGLHLDKANAAQCQCLAVAVGLPNDPRMRWDGQIPSIDPNTQIALAITSEGTECPKAPKDSLGASYHGYRTNGADVIVEIESGRMGRPIAGGAIIPKPAPKGRIIIQAVDEKSPFGRALNGNNASCVVWTTP
jgi:hypothetical protein